MHSRSISAVSTPGVCNCCQALNGNFVESRVTSGVSTKCHAAQSHQAHDSLPRLLPRVGTLAASIARVVRRLGTGHPALFRPLTVSPLARCGLGPSGGGSTTSLSSDSPIPRTIESRVRDQESRVSGRSRVATWFVSLAMCMVASGSLMSGVPIRGTIAFHVGQDAICSERGTRIRGFSQ